MDKHPPPSLQVTLEDCLALVRSQLPWNPGSLSRLSDLHLTLLRLEYRLLYLLHSSDLSQPSSQDCARYLELNRLLNPHLQHLPQLPPLRSPFSLFKQQQHLAPGLEANQGDRSPLD